MEMYMETNMEDKNQDSSEKETETEEEARNPFGYQVGDCCAVGVCQLPTAHLNP
jgi:prolyl-tRNA editing enzyme YbaK/EbsC (Cys-tRNA(Pro) deacylase)